MNKEDVFKTYVAHLCCSSEGYVSVGYVSISDTNIKEFRGLKTRRLTDCSIEHVHLFSLLLKHYIELEFCSNIL